MMKGEFASKVQERKPIFLEADFEDHDMEEHYTCSLCGGNFK